MKANLDSGGRRKRAGNLLMVCGAVLLGSFFVFKGWSANQSAAGLDAFEAAKAVHAQRSGSNSTIIETAVQKSPTAAGPAVVKANGRLESTALSDIPDTSLWSAKRVAEYEATKAAGGEAPQAVLRIDQLDINVPVYNGADEFNLNRGVARIIGTGRVGEIGNLGIAGHRDSFFRPLKDIEIGDTLELETFHGTEEYRVSSIEIVEPTALHVLGPSDTQTVTLVTCYPFYYVGNAPQRFIVKAEALNNQVNS
ncbi:MAG: class D sortase [Xanthomonadales bacterium]|jgi:LPXTG-site transpeptidase (sortase) family protein|nr:class D sortase [Xanthomonadales bacterium]